LRILGFEKHWEKLARHSYTTFRFPRKDKDWYVGERVKIVVNPRSKRRRELGVAEIKDKTKRWLGRSSSKCPCPTEDEAVEDGFKDAEEMRRWMREHYGGRVEQEPMNKLSLSWIEKC